MTYARAVVAALILSGCYGEGVPPALVAPDPAVSLWGMVITDSGVCVHDATVRVVRGQGLGRSAAQETPCGAWDYAGGFVFNRLIPGVEMTLRISAPGYVTEDIRVVPEWDQHTALLITATRE